MRRMICLLICAAALGAPGTPTVEERIHAAWLGQILGTLMGSGLSTGRPRLNSRESAGRTADGCAR